ncbi:MAG: hypothetical protein ABL925_08865, partial [Methylococcales bacterium]
IVVWQDISFHVSSSKIDNDSIAVHYFTAAGHRETTLEILAENRIDKHYSLLIWLGDLCIEHQGGRFVTMLC